MKKLNLEEIKRLSDAALGCQLAELCGFYLHKESNHYRSPKFKFYMVSRLCSELDAVAEVERIVIEKDVSAYTNSLLDVLNVGDLVHAETWNVEMPESLSKMQSKTFSVGYHTKILRACRLCATATARQRAEAALLALQETE